MDNIKLIGLSIEAYKEDKKLKGLQNIRGEGIKYLPKQNNRTTQAAELTQLASL